MADNGFHMDRPMELDFHVAAPSESAALQVAERRARKRLPRGCVRLTPVPAALDVRQGQRHAGERTVAAVMHEVKVDRSVWESQRLLDRSDEATDSPFVDDYLRDRANRSLQHVFTLLSLTLPKEPLIVAFRGLHTSDEALRGTALE